MIEFKENVEILLPYNREHYIDFLADDFNSPIEWYGASFQWNSEGESISSTQFFAFFEVLFKNVILKLHNGSSWIINHDDKDLDWFPNDEDNLTSLRSLFKQQNMPNTFSGALIFSTDDLLVFSRDLISYPCCVFNKVNLLYKNVDISHAELPFIIKISGHLNIDLLSTDKALVAQVIHENASDHFKIIAYRQRD